MHGTIIIFIGGIVWKKITHHCVRYEFMYLMLFFDCILYICISPRKGCMHNSFIITKLSLTTTKLCDILVYVLLHVYTFINVNTVIIVYCVFFLIRYIYIYIRMKGVVVSVRVYPVLLMIGTFPIIIYNNKKGTHNNKS